MASAAATAGPSTRSSSTRCCDLAGGTPIEVRAGEDTPLVLALEKAAGLAGRVSFRDRAPDQVPAVQVRVFDEQGKLVAEPPADTANDYAFAPRRPRSRPLLPDRGRARRLAELRLAAGGLQSLVLRPAARRADRDRGRRHRRRSRPPAGADRSLRRLRGHRHRALPQPGPLPGGSHLARLRRRFRRRRGPPADRRNRLLLLLLARQRRGDGQGARRLRHQPRPPLLDLRRGHHQRPGRARGDRHPDRREQALLERPGRDLPADPRYRRLRHLRCRTRGFRGRRRGGGKGYARRTAPPGSRKRGCRSPKTRATPASTTPIPRRISPPGSAWAGVSRSTSYGKPPPSTATAAATGSPATPAPSASSTRRTSS